MFCLNDGLDNDYEMLLVIATTRQKLRDILMNNKRLEMGANYTCTLFIQSGRLTSLPPLSVDCFGHLRKRGVTESSYLHRPKSQKK